MRGLKIKKKKFLKKLNDKGIETRPIVSGNFMNQPVIKKFRLNKGNKKFLMLNLLKIMVFLDCIQKK